MDELCYKLHFRYTKYGVNKYNNDNLVQVLHSWSVDRHKNELFNAFLDSVNTASTVTSTTAE